MRIDRFVPADLVDIIVSYACCSCDICGETLPTSRFIHSLVAYPTRCGFNLGRASDECFLCEIEFMAAYFSKLDTTFLLSILAENENFLLNEELLYDRLLAPNSFRHRSTGMKLVWALPDHLLLRINAFPINDKDHKLEVTYQETKETFFI